ncbi:kinase-like domain-containing protein [Aspergillus pseudonomiae]|uniref:Kinase-like domain-containing protein n=1 Tax=Aspergillus pseudonomiae TaxID=1506151 RepID=A0A5N7CTK4_9EURO|nr:kinase-like domain-containing protein [Aspergillus pseudonomiae]KAE8396923.1 kinase-like domain-containing protein [Aspergillus pseudonomiae]
MSSKKEKHLTLLDVKHLDSIKPPASLPGTNASSTVQANKVEHLVNKIPYSSGCLTEKTSAPLTQINEKIKHDQHRDEALLHPSNSGYRSLPVLHKVCPWKSFKKRFDCDLAGTVAIVTRRSDPSDIQTIRQFAPKDGKNVMQALRSLRHEKIFSATECFQFDGILYTVSEFYPLTLEHIVACKVFPNERQLAAIMEQFLSGLSYLSSKRIRHTSLKSSSILMSIEGQIKIARIDCCRRRSPDEPSRADLISVANVTMELMQGYVKDEGVVGVDSLNRSSSGSTALDFLSTTTSANSVDELRKHPLITKTSPSMKELMWLAWFALYSARTFWSYTPSLDEVE